LPVPHAGNPIAGKMSNVLWLRGMMNKRKPLVTCLNIATQQRQIILIKQAVSEDFSDSSRHRPMVRFVQAAQIFDQKLSEHFAQRCRTFLQNNKHIHCLFYNLT
jgi:hypothetical protein